MSLSSIEVMNMPLPPNHYHGIVQRKGRVFGAWKYRYFVLYKGYIYFYHREGEGEGVDAIDNIDHNHSQNDNHNRSHNDNDGNVHEVDDLDSSLQTKVPPITIASEMNYPNMNYLGRPLLLWNYQIKLTTKQTKMKRKTDSGLVLDQLQHQEQMSPKISSLDEDKQTAYVIHLYRPSTPSNNYRTLVMQVFTEQDSQGWMTAIRLHIQYLGLVYQRYLLSYHSQEVAESKSFDERTQEEDDELEDKFIRYFKSLSCHAGADQETKEDNFPLHVEDSKDLIELSSHRSEVVSSNPSVEVPATILSTHNNSSINPINDLSLSTAMVSFLPPPIKHPIGLESTSLLPHHGGGDGVTGPSAFDSRRSYSLIEPPEHMGYIRKQGHVFKTWKLRYFVLSKGILNYFNSVLDISFPDKVLAPPMPLHDYDITSPTNLRLCLRPSKASSDSSQPLPPTESKKPILLLEFVDSSTLTEWQHLLQRHIEYADLKTNSPRRRSTHQIKRYSLIPTSDLLLSHEEEDNRFEAHSGTVAHVEVSGDSVSRSTDDLIVGGEPSFPPVMESSAFVESSHATPAVIESSSTAHPSDEMQSHSFAADTGSASGASPLRSNLVRQKSNVARQMLATPTEPKVPKIIVPNDYSGIIRKQGHFFKSWKLRFFVLRRGVLNYYQDELAFVSSKAVPLGSSLRLGNVAIAKLLPNRIQLKFKDSILLLECESAEVCDRWMREMELHKKYLLALAEDVGMDDLYTNSEKSSFVNYS